MTLLKQAAEIAAEISTRLAQITVANGFNTDIGLRVFRGKLSKVQEDVPCAVLIEGEDIVEDRQRGSVKLRQGYVCGGYNECDPDNPNDAAHLMIKDIKRVIFAGEANFGRKVLEVRYEGRDIGPRTDGVALVFAVVHISVVYAEDLDNP